MVLAYREALNFLSLNHTCDDTVNTRLQQRGHTFSAALAAYNLKPLGEIVKTFSLNPILLGSQDFYDEITNS